MGADAAEGTTDPGPSRGAPKPFLGTAGFDAEMTRHAQGRLRLAVAALWLIAGGAWVLSLGTSIAAGGWRLSWLWDPELLVLEIALAVGAVILLLLRKPDVPARRVHRLDALLMIVLELVCAAAYHLDYLDGGGHGIEFMGVLLFARSVLVPSRTRRTLFLSLPAGPLVFAVQWAHAAAGHPLPTPLQTDPAAPWTDMWWAEVAWVQFYLLVCLGLALVATTVTFRLRIQANEALRLGPYQLQERIGAGAMGEVYRAKHALMSRPVAVKFMRSDLVGEATIRRFQHEVHQTSRLTHPNTIAIYDFGITPDGVFYYAMELLDGSDLQRVVDATGPMPASRTIHLLAQALAALHEAHTMGLVHRDVKPGNLFVCARGLEHDVVKVMDFGLVKDVSGQTPALSGVGEPVGSPLTMAPEVLRGRPPDARADLYALAAVGCFLLTGTPIFDAATVPEYLSAHLTQPPIPPSQRLAGVPADLETVLLRSLAKEPGERHASAAEMRGALLACADAGLWSETHAAAWWEKHRDEI